MSESKLQALLKEVRCVAVGAGPGWALLGGVHVLLSRLAGGVRGQVASGRSGGCSLAQPLPWNPAAAARDAPCRPLG